MEGKVLKNAQNVSLQSITPTAFAQLRVALRRENARTAAFFALPAGPNEYRLFLLRAHDADGELRLYAVDTGDHYASLTPSAPEVHLFEREIFEQHRIKPEGHPWLKPVRFQAPLDQGAAAAPECGVMPFYRVGGLEEHEVAVGPVHAGVIEPGHFRFQCHGEVVHHLEISLGYQHRGIERALLGGPHKRTMLQAETVAGDTTIGHGWAYCQVIESLSGSVVPARAQAIRAVALELERLANHTGDLGALAQDVGYLPAASYCGRIRGDFLNMTAAICGSRLGRNLVRPGGVKFDIEPDLREELLKRLHQTASDLDGALELLFQSQSVIARFENTGELSAEQCRKAGLVGVAARASGIPHDVRKNFPFGPYAELRLDIPRCQKGTVYCRAKVRHLEVLESIRLVRSLLEALPEGDLTAPVGELQKDSCTFSLIEGWRGEICHAAVTDSAGRFRAYKIVDPSFHNWTGLALALRRQEISDFPLCNKSFNLSYAGFDQ